MHGRHYRRSDNTRLYDVLGIPRHASQDEIRRAYRKAAIKDHPDKGGDPDKFKELAQAYEILSHPEKRERYDQYGEDAVREWLGGIGSINPFDVFESFFGSGGGAFGGSSRSRRQKRGEDIVHPLKVSLEELYEGTTKKFPLTRNVTCENCKGQGTKAGAATKCSGCQGAGMKLTPRQLGPGTIQLVQQDCPECGGAGETVNERDKCSQCKGNKVLADKKLKEVIIEQGMVHGEKITFQGQADEAPEAIAGDIVIVLQLQDHPKFKRKGDDLFYEHRLSLSEALCGFQFPLTHLDSRQLLVKSNPGEVIKSGQVKAIHEEGMPHHGNPSHRGTLYIHFIVEYPESGSLSPEKCKLLESLLPPRLTSPMTDKEVEECAEITLHDVNIEEEMKRKQQQQQESYDEDEEESGPKEQCAQQ